MVLSMSRREINQVHVLWDLLAERIRTREGVGYLQRPEDPLHPGTAQGLGLHGNAFRQGVEFAHGTELDQPIESAAQRPVAQAIRMLNCTGKYSR